MKPQSNALAPLLSTSICLCLALAGCPSQPTPTAPFTPTPAPVPASQTTPKPQPPGQISVGQAPLPVVHSAKTVDPTKSGGIRGLQPVTFVIKAGDEAVEAASVTVRTTDGKPAGSGTSNDWGEFRTSLAPGRYNVIVQWQGERTIRPVQIDVTTQEIPLSLTLPNP